ncbi:MAG: InlB B-repeat-containing protein, partial [Clostridia bacterium]|nr:InlB B-repeat-containing protein [Clostridia bacterium]
MYKAKQRWTTLLLACFAVLVSVLLALTLWTAPMGIRADAESPTVTDTLNQTTIGITNTTYASWSGKTSNSDAVYAGQSAGGNSSIQLRSSNSNSGIVTTTSGGNIKKVTVVWNSNTASGRTLNVYASTSAYTNPTELYGSSLKGKLVGTIVNGTSTELEINEDYAYVGVRSSSGAMYLTSISFTWEVASACAHDYQLKGENGKHIMTCTKCGEVQENAVEENCIGSNWSLYTTNNGVHSRTGNCTLCGASVTESGECEISAEYVREGNQHTQTGTCNICQASTSVTEDCTLTTDGYAPLDTDNKAEQQHAVTTTCSVCEKTATANESCSFDEGVLEGSTRTYTCQHCEYSYSEEVTLYTVNYVVSGETAPESQPVVANETVTLPNGDDYNEYTFVGWTTESLNGETNEAPDYTKVGDTYEVTKDVTFYALYSKTESTGDWTKVTDVNKLAVGYEIVIVASNESYALSTTQNTSNRASVAITKNGDTVTINESVQIITLETGTVNNTFAFKVDDGYLYAASSSSNHLKTQATLDANGSWLITISSNGVATIKAQGTYTRNWLKFNTSNSPKLFSCYSSGQTDVSIYMKDTTTYYVTAEGTCVHTYEIDEENSQPATCTENGLEIKICTKCDDRVEETVYAPGHAEVHTIISEATCQAVGSKTITCENCSELNETIELPILPHDYQGGKCTACGEILPAQATLTFDDTAKRTEFSTEKQVWTENSIILTNDKAESTNNVANYADPVRFYKSSTITIEYPQMFVIVFTCNT